MLYLVVHTAHLLKYNLSESVVWVELGNDLCTGHLSLNQFHALLRQRLTSLRHIPVETVSVVDHLGRDIPVPTIFCSTWKVGYVTSACWWYRSSRQTRTLTISSTAIAKIALEVIMWSEVIIK